MTEAVKVMGWEKEKVKEQVMRVTEGMKEGVKVVKIVEVGEE